MQPSPIGARLDRNDPGGQSRIVPQGSTNRVSSINASSQDSRNPSVNTVPIAIQTSRPTRRRTVLVQKVIPFLPFAGTQQPFTAPRRDRMRRYGPVEPQSIKMDERSKTPPTAVSQSRINAVSVAVSADSEIKLEQVVPKPVIRNPPVKTSPATVTIRRKRDRIPDSPIIRERNSPSIVHGRADLATRPCQAKIYKRFTRLARQPPHFHLYRVRDSIGGFSSVR